MSKIIKFVFSILLCLITSSTILFASITDTNRQEIVSVDSPIYRAMKNLYISTGLALPSTTEPWTMAEFDIMLSRIDVNALSEEERATYEYLDKEINGGGSRFNPEMAEGIFGFSISADAAIEAMTHTNAEDFSNYDYWMGWNKVGDFYTPTPLISVPLETWFGDNIYGFSSIYLSLNRNLASADAAETKILANFPIDFSALADDISYNYPNRAFGSIGGAWWNIAIGRDKLRWGPGESGNLTVGDQVPYHNNLRFTAFSNVFKYTFSISSFVHPKNYTKADPNNSDRDILDLNYSQRDPRSGLSMFIAHRLEWRILDKVNMALTESMMYQSEENQFDLLTLSPTAIFHNFYIRSNSNSLLSFEIDYAFIDHWNVYGEVVIDEFGFGALGDPNAVINPSAFGFIAGFKTAYPIANGILYGSIEGAYTDPFLYIRDDGASYDGDKYGINFIVANPEIGKDSAYDLDFLGYRYGNDSIVANLKVGYEEYGKWNAEFEFTYWADGCMDMNSRWKRLSFNDTPFAPSKDHSATGNYDSESNWESRNAVAHWFISTIKGSYTIIENLDIYSQVRLINVLNMNNIKSDEVSTDFQFSIGISYSI